MIDDAVTLQTDDEKSCFDEIPKEWITDKLGNYIKEHSIKNKCNQNCKVVSVTKYNGIVDSLTYFKKSVYSDDLSNYKVIKKGQFAYSPIHLNEGSIGYLTIYDEAILSPMYKVFEIDKTKLKKEYLYSLLKTKKYIDLYNRVGKGSVDRRASVSLKDFKSIVITIPPLQEQEQIVSILSKVDEQIEQTEQIIEKTELLKKGLMQKIFVYGTENQKLKEIDVKYSPKKWIIPENWTTKLFNEITFQITDGTHFTPHYTDKGVPFLRVTDIQSDSVDWNSVKYISEEEHKELIKRCKPEKGNVLLSKNGTIGIPKIIDWDQEFSIFVSLCLIKVNTDIMGVRYLYHLLKSDLVRNQYALRAKTGTVTNLHLEEIRELTIPIPPLEEQVKISHIMDSFDTELKYENNYLTKLQELKKGLMQDLLTGKVRVCV